MSNICVIGTGYVGLVAIAAFADKGHRVVGLDVDRAKVAMLRRGDVPFFEPGVAEVLSKPENRERTTFTTEYAEGVPGSDFVFVCVNTPPDRRGRPRMDQITSAARELSRHLGPGTIVVNKSTGPVGMVDLIRRVLVEHDERHCGVAVVSNPEFLSQGRALHDFMHPYQVVIGADDERAASAVAKLYEPFGSPIHIVQPRAAEMTKLVSNAFRAMKVSFTNEVSTICEKLQVDVTQVMGLLSADKAIGPAFLAAGVGWGGNCLPKDVSTLEYVAKASGATPRMLRASREVNAAQRESVVSKVRRLMGGTLGHRVAVLGLAFKGGTDDVRESPAVAVVRKLVDAGCSVRVHDPMAMSNARRILGASVTYCDSPYQAAEHAQALVLLTDCPEYRDLDLRRLASVMDERNLIDGRNFFASKDAEEAGFVYAGMGRGYPSVHPVPEMRLDNVRRPQAA